MFTQKKDRFISMLKEQIAQLESESQRERQANLNALKERDHAHRMAMAEKDFEIKHLADNRVKELEGKVVALEKELAVRNQKIEMLDKLVDLKAGIVDIKDLINAIVKKLPEVNINGLTVNAPKG